MPAESRARGDFSEDLRWWPVPLNHEFTRLRLELSFLFMSAHGTRHTRPLDVLPNALCLLLCPVSAAFASIFRMDSICTSYIFPAAHSPFPSLQHPPISAHPPRSTPRKVLRGGIQKTILKDFSGHVGDSR
jgi:hypothetical protein